MTDGPSPAMKLSDADRLDTLKRIVAEADAYTTEPMLPDEIAAIEWAAVEIQQLRFELADALDSREGHHGRREALERAALDRAGKANEDS